MFSPEAVPLRLKFRMLPVATPSARAEPDTSLIRTTDGVSTTIGGIRWPVAGFLTILPALVLSGMMLGAIGLLLSSTIRQLENFAGVMNFVIFPMFFASSALYPLWRLRESSTLLHDIAAANPFTYATELIRFALYGQVNLVALAVVVGCTLTFMGAAIYAYDPSKGLIGRRRR